MKVVFRSGQSLHFMLTKMKDALAMEKLSNVVYWVPCSCGRAYVSTLGDIEKTRNQSEGAPECLSEGGTGELSQRLHSMHGRTTTRSSGRRPQW